MKTTIYFSKVKEKAIIPSKKEEDAGYDIYGILPNITDKIIVLPHETVMIPTGIASAIDKDYAFILKERGSTGSKGIAQRCGVIDSGYRGEWFVPITNTSNIPLVLGYFLPSPDFVYNLKADSGFKEYKFYSLHNAICQALLIKVPNTEIIEIAHAELLQIESLRGENKLGSSNKTNNK